MVVAIAVVVIILVSGGGSDDKGSGGASSGDDRRQGGAHINLNASYGSTNGVDPGRTRRHRAAARRRSPT